MRIFNRNIINKFNGGSYGILTRDPLIVLPIMLAVLLNTAYSVQITPYSSQIILKLYA